MISLGPLRQWWDWKRQRIRWRVHAYRVACPTPKHHPAMCACWLGKGKWKIPRER